MWEEGIPCSLGEDAQVHFLPLFSNGPTASCSSSTDQPSDGVIPPACPMGFFCLRLLALLSVCLSIYLCIHLSLSFCLLCSLPPSFPPNFPPPIALSLFLLSSPLCVSLGHMSRIPQYYFPSYTSPSYFLWDPQSSFRPLPETTVHLQGGSGVSTEAA